MAGATGGGPRSHPEAASNGRPEGRSPGKGLCLPKPFVGLVLPRSANGLRGARLVLMARFGSRASSPRLISARARRRLVRSHTGHGPRGRLFLFQLTKAAAGGGGG